MISGEIKRFLRDDGLLKVSRSLKELAGKAGACREELRERLRREPTVTEIAGELGVEQEELAMALEAGGEVESLQKPIFQKDGRRSALWTSFPSRKAGRRKCWTTCFWTSFCQSLEARRDGLSTAVFRGADSVPGGGGTGDLPGAGVPAGEEDTKTDEREDLTGAPAYIFREQGHTKGKEKGCDGMDEARKKLRVCLICVVAAAVILGLVYCLIDVGSETAVSDGSWCGQRRQRESHDEKPAGDCLS